MISRIAPIFGFIGTIIGMIILLREFASLASPSISEIADAMYVNWSRLFSDCIGILPMPATKLPQFPDRQNRE